MATASATLRLAPLGSVPASCRQIRSAPNSPSHFFAQATGSPQTSPSTLLSSSAQSAGVVSNTSIAIFGALGSVPSNEWNASAFWPPTVTVFFEPSVSSRILAVDVSTGA